MDKPKLPKPSRGILAAIAKERGITLPAVMRHYYNGKPEYVNRVVELENQYDIERRKALMNYAKSLGFTTMHSFFNSMNQEEQA
jgi:hypothetical protein